MRKNNVLVCALNFIHAEYSMCQRKKRGNVAKSARRKIGEQTVKRAISRIAVHWSRLPHRRFAADGVPWCDDAMVYQARGDSRNQQKRVREREGGEGVREKEKKRRGQTVATSRKQSGRRPLKILLRIVCHF